MRLKRERETAERRPMPCFRRLVIAALVGLLVMAAPPATLAHPPIASSSGVVRGTVVSLDWAELTVQSAGPRLAVIPALTRAADAVAAEDYPYVWGGGHAFAGTPSAGMRGRGHNGRQVGFDCSGSVAAVLAGAGLWAPGTGVPSDAGVIHELRQANLIVRGPGKGAHSVTLWDDRGVHVFMEIGSAFFGTSDGGPPSVDNPQGGPGWLDDGAPDTLNRHYRAWHLVGPALAGRVDTGRLLTVALGGPLAYAASGLAVGDRVGVRYGTRHRALVALAVNPL